MKVAKASEIVNNPNDWSDDPLSIIDLLKRIVTVSLKTMSREQRSALIGLS